MPRRVAINLHWRTRPGNFATRIHGFSQSAASKECITSMNLSPLENKVRPSAYDVKNRDPPNSGTSRGSSDLTPIERELMTGMGNCYASCHEDFEQTVEMVGDARGLTVDQVKKMLQEIRGKYGADADYQRLRGRLPKDFPL